MSYNDFNVTTTTNISGVHDFPRGTFNNAHSLLAFLNVTAAAGGSTPSLIVTVLESLDSKVTWLSTPVITFTTATTSTTSEIKNIKITDTPFSGDLRLAWTIAGGNSHSTLTTALTGSNNDIDYTSALSGTAGNATSITYADIGVNGTLGVVVSGQDIVFNLKKSAATYAALTTSLTGSNNDLVWTARTAGSAGNSIALIYDNSAAQTATTASLSGTTLTIDLATQVTTAALTTTMTGTNNDVVLTAVAPGSAGNNVSLTLVNPGSGTHALAVSVSSNDITVNLGYGSGAITTTGSLLIAALNASTAAAALMTATLAAANDGTGLVTALSKTNLTGGNDKSIVATANDVRNCIDHSPANALVGVQVAGGNDGTGVVTALSSTALSTGADAAISSTSGQILTALAASTPASALVSGANHSGNDGTGVVTVMAKTLLDNTVGNYTFTIQGMGK